VRRPTGPYQPALRILAFADLHLDVPFAWADERIARLRRANRRRTLANIIELAQRERVDYLLCAGDLFEHDRITPDTIAFLHGTLAASGIRTFLAPGNHDWIGPESPYAQQGWGENVTVFREDHLVPIELVDGVTLWGAAHRAPANTDNFFSDFRVDRGGINLVVAHASEQSALPVQGGKKLPHAPFDASELEQAGIDFALLGHYHFPSEGPRFAYAGNPDPLEFGETGERGALLLSVGGDGRLVHERRRVAVSEVHDVVLRLDGERHRDEVAARISSEVAALNGCVRVTLEGEIAPSVGLDLRELAEVAPHLDTLVLRTRTLNVTYDIDAIAGEATVRGQFVRAALSQELDEVKRRRVVLTGLRAFDGRRDLEVL
jgi:DNA repair protein SbcD/Mre11